MSHKHKYYHDKPNYTKPQDTTPVVEPAVVMEDEVVMEEPKTTPVVEPEVVKEPTLGTVVDCDKLRVRKQPNAMADVLCEIKDGSEVMIDEEESTDNFYKVCTETGVEGFCMKQFIDIKQ